MGKYWHITAAWLERILIYRARIIIWFFTDSLHFLVLPFVWLTIYGSRQTLLGYSRSDIVTYYIVTAIISWVGISSINNPIRRDILRGDLNMHLAKPFNYLLYHSVHEVAYKIINLQVGGIFLLALLLALPRYVHGPQSWWQALGFLIFLVFSFALSQLLSMAVALTSFWWGENSALNQVQIGLQQLFSGGLAPLPFLPGALQTMANYLPFKYLSYLPTQIYLGRISGQDLGLALVQFGIWLLGALLFVRWLWHRGLTQYDGAGI